ncbi:hypothetical protein Aduo_012815 [Ancylostoma duodenale]
MTRISELKGNAGDTRRETEVVMRQGENTKDLPLGIIRIIFEKKRTEGISKKFEESEGKFEVLLRTQRGILKRIGTIENEVKTLKRDIPVQERIEATTEAHTQQLLRKLEKIQAPLSKEENGTVAEQRADGNPQLQEQVEATKRST